MTCWQAEVQPGRSKIFVRTSDVTSKRYQDMRTRLGFAEWDLLLGWERVGVLETGLLAKHPDRVRLSRQVNVSLALIAPFCEPGEAAISTCLSQLARPPPNVKRVFSFETAPSSC